MDLPPVLIALGAEVDVAGPAGERVVAVEDLFTGYLETVLANNELITAVSIPPQTGRHAVYVKCTARTADDWPALGLAVSVRAEGRDPPRCPHRDRRRDRDRAASAASRGGARRPCCQ
jgi:carbon-monoxide dehydrogenase medium subunit